MLQAIDRWWVNTLNNTLGANSTAFYYVHEYWEKDADPRSADLYFVRVSQATIALIMLVYIINVWGLIPFFMRNRAPFNLKKIIIAYDLFLVAINAYFFIKSIQLADYGREFHKLEDTKGDTSERAMEYIRVAHLYYVSKLVDMFDTFFMAFRKRYSQISFLHVWHHTSLSYAAWLYMKYNPYTPSILIIPFINGYIHVVMYLYYALAALGPHMQKYLWWKKYITQIQLFQFTAVFAWYIYVAFSHKNLPVGYLFCNLFNAAFLFTLFTHFYIQSYRKPAKAAKKD